MNILRDLCLVVLISILGYFGYIVENKLNSISQDVKATQSILLMHIDKVEKEKKFSINEAIKGIFAEEK